ncbi:acyl carrier protein [Streptomyces sp. NPDC001843]|uniref:acyl carrier protein n=1 Tax=Streptomyces sp. NPDC001843 TaxID=3364617 RepID=UPI0036BD3980
MTTQTREDISSELLTYIRESFLAGDPEGELDADTPLLELGILNSLNTAILVAHLGEEYGVHVPLIDVTATTFKSVRTLSELVHESLSQK